MKKTVCVILLAAVLSISVLAGDIPEQILNDDSAEVFFAELVSYTEGEKFAYAEIIPSEILKGDVIPETVCTLQDIEPIGGFSPEEGETYLFAYLNGNGFFFDMLLRNNQNEVAFRGNVGDMWKRFERYINDGVVENSEADRIKRRKEAETIGEKITLADFLGVTREDAERVSLHYGHEFIEPDKDVFYDIAESVILTNIENVSLQSQVDATTSRFPEGMNISVNGFDGFAFIADNGYADRCGMHMSRLPVGDYSIGKDDVERLKSFFAPKADAVKAEVNEKNILLLLGVAFAVTLAATGIFMCRKRTLQ